VEGLAGACSGSQASFCLVGVATDKTGTDFLKTFFGTTVFDLAFLLNFQGEHF